MKFSFFLVLSALLLGCSFALADISMTYPKELTLKSGGAIDAGFVSPGQIFDIVFSDNSGYGFEWDSISVPPSLLPDGWEVASTQRTDTSLLARVRAPANASSGQYSLSVGLSNSSQNSGEEMVSVSVIVKRNLLDVSFARKSADAFYFVGGKVIYSATVSNSSIAPDTLRFTSTLPATWFAEKSLSIKPGTIAEAELVVSPQTSGIIPFSLQAFASDQVIVGSYSSELNVKPTLKGKLGAPLSGFPFYNFSLLPFELINSLFSALLK